MHIVVTIPKKMLKQVEEEEAAAARWAEKGVKVDYFWSIRNYPKRLLVGERCYFVWEGAVRAYHIVKGYAKDQRCQHTGVVYPGLVILMDGTIYDLEKPVPCRGFQNFRYADRITGMAEYSNA